MQDRRRRTPLIPSEDQSQALGQELFHNLRDRVARECRRLKQTAEVLAQLDVLTGLATIAVRHRYCRPAIVEEPCLEIRDGRHPVLDRLQPSGEFVPNDVILGSRGEGRGTRGEGRGSRAEGRG